MQILSEHERTSVVWKVVKTHLEEHLEVLRKQNDTSKSVGETEKLRGRIAEVKHMLGLDKDRPETESNDIQTY